ncbi:MAG TPA: cytochrome c-type biogenesis protein [Chloroflexota bacterium]|jgi:cytochrome c-type biogenesis protein CcmH|nr:cytochrome c-type biogenesis protein [Chloroflexota bacterium]
MNAVRRAGVGLAMGLLALLWVSGAAAQQADPPLSPEALEIARSLKCLICQNQSVADSPSPLAQEMRAYIARRLAAGDSREAIVRDLVERYGEEILLEPPRAGFTGLVWWLPVASLAVGALAIALTLRPRQRADVSPDEAPLAALAPEELAQYRQRLAAELARREGGHG